ncbi:MAG: DNA-processing protein DprA [Alphaproteobacteria bacterium]|nr:DNA-processing protein DprA [Alphaproteobacteria bacterium]
MAEDVILDYLQLINTNGIGPVSFHKLVAEYGSVKDALAALAKKTDVFSKKEAEAELKSAHKNNVSVICLEDEAYPALIKELNDAPPVLYVKGRVDLLNYPASVSVVGSRNASVIGRKIASRLAYDLTNSDVLIVSGMARGIDSAAHKGAMYAKNQNGPTIAVLGTGVDVCYPEENKALYDQIIAQGALVSEFIMGEKANASNFPRRNRLVAGLGAGVLVVEASVNSGSLITARLGLEQGKDIFAVPGSPFDNKSGGCNQLIKDGALLIESADDVLQTLAVTQNRTLKINQNANLNAKPLDNDKKESMMQQNTKTDVEPKGIVEVIGSSGIEQDDLIRHLGLPTSEALMKVTELELDGLVERKNGSFLVLTKQGLRKLK